MGNQPNSEPQSPARRHALRRLAGTMIAAYVVPQVVFLSAAKADSVSVASTPSGPTGPSIPGPSGPVSPDTETPEDTVGYIEPDDDGEDPKETCNQDDGPRSQGIQITRSDMNRSREAIEAGYARPLEQIWSEFIGQYNGRIVGVEFTGRRKNPRYKFRAISPTGRLETVVISAQTGEIIRITGC